jgi:hypothetical protein
MPSPGRVLVHSTFKVKVQWKVSEFGPILKSVAETVAAGIQMRSRMDIMNSGLRNPSRISKGLTTKVRKRREGWGIQVFLRPNYANVWEYGGTSIGKPLLWIRQKAKTPATKRAGAFKRGKLFKPPGRNALLFNPKGSDKPEELYAGVASVTHQRRFHLRKIAYEEANHLTDILARAMK